MQKRSTDLVVTGACCLAIGLMYLWSYGRGVSQIPKGMGDFIHFYAAAEAMLHGRDIFASGTGGYIYPPLIAFVYLPLAKLSLAAAARTDLIINIFLSATTLFLAARECARRVGLQPRPVLLAVIAAIAAASMADKIRTELRMGQTDVLMLLCFTLGLVWLRRRPTLAGLALGFAFNIKYLPLVLLPYLIVRRRWHAALAFVAGILLFAFLPALYT
ncbi:MAG: glycosyltransferase family 87 protein, partial [Phycisphaerales bacterium]